MAPSFLLKPEMLGVFGLQRRWNHEYWCNWNQAMELWNNKTTQQSTYVFSPIFWAKQNFQASKIRTLFPIKTRGTKAFVGKSVPQHACFCLLYRGPAPQNHGSFAVSQGICCGISHLFSIIFLVFLSWNTEKWWEVFWKTSQVSVVLVPTTRDEGPPEKGGGKQYPWEYYKTIEKHAQGTRKHHPTQVPKYIHHDMEFAAQHWWAQC